MTKRGINMRINNIDNKYRNVVFTYFRGTDNEDEYVYVPLVWNELPDTFSSSSYDKSAPKKNNGIFKTTLHGLGTVSLLPVATDKIGNGIKSISGKLHEVTSSVKEDIAGTVQDLKDIKHEILDAKDRFKKAADDNHQDIDNEVITETSHKKHTDDIDKQDETDDNDINDDFDDIDYDDFDDTSDLDLGI